MRVLVVAEFYPRAADPVLGIWAHRQATAARDAGADVRVAVLHRPLPASASARDPAAWRGALGQPRRAQIDGIEVSYVRYLSPPRPRSYGSWGAWAAPALAVHLRRERRAHPFDLVHAHNAVPAADAALHAGIREPLVVSVHGGDVLYTAQRHARGARAVRGAYSHARLVLANSAGIERLAADHGARQTRVVHLGTDLPAPAPPTRPRTIATVAHLVARKRHADVIRALPQLDGVDYLIVGDGPERPALEGLARELGVQNRVEFAGQLPHDQALAAARECAAFVMPATDEAFGVAYVEAMAAGRPAVGLASEPGPQEIAAAGGGMVLARREELPAAIRRAMQEPGLGDAARATVERAFTWERCGRETLAAYEQALA